MTADRTIDRYTRVSNALSSPEAHVVLEREAADVLPSLEPAGFAAFPLGIILGIVLRADPDRVTRILELLADVPDPTPVIAQEPTPDPSPDYEGPSVARASARVEVEGEASTDAPVDLVLHGPEHGNPFLDVELTATLRLGDDVISVGGFYDGGGVYRIRFLAPAAGEWSVETRSNARSLDGIRSTLTVSRGTGHGPVRAVGDGFEHADGTVFTPWGTTAYAWTHQPEELQQRTLTALSAAPFTKLRMCLFPKSFLYNANDPERFVFPRRDDGSFDMTRFDVEYFRRLEARLRDLDALGIEADLILFHPYDRWGFSELGSVVDDRYVRYAVRRLAGFRNVWWSLANEYELLTTKRPDDWDRIGRLIRDEDPVGHPRSVHNIVDVWDADVDWVTHSSIQAGDPIGDKVQEWRGRWSKPLLVDETGYEGDLDQGWGNLTGEDMLLRFWQVLLRGGFATHGETFWNPEEIVFWAKGGDLIGESPARIAFLRRLVEEAPGARLHPLPSEFDAVWAGVAGAYVLIHYGRGRPLFRDVPIPAGHRARIDVIDTWAMTIAPVEGVHEGTTRVQLGGRPHMALRLHLERIAP